MEFHDAVTAGHLGVRRTFDKLNRSNYYWPHLRRYVQDYIASYDIKEIHSDQGAQFESQLFREMFKVLQINKTRTTSYHPQSDGMIERLNRTIKDILSKYISVNQTDWDKIL